MRQYREESSASDTYLSRTCRGPIWQQIPLPILAHLVLFLPESADTGREHLDWKQQVMFSSSMYEVGGTENKLEVAAA